MSSKLCAPYEGDRPYLYISYCPKDRDIVLPILRFLQDEGCRIWYDGSGDPDAQWSGAAARRLDQSAAFLALISENWTASRPCLAAFTFAQMKRLPSLSVLLEPVEPAPAMKLQIASVPAIGQSTPEALREKLLPLLDRLAPALRTPETASTRRGPRSRRPLVIAAAAVLIFTIGTAAAFMARGSGDAPAGAPKLPAVSTESGTALVPSPEPEMDRTGAYHLFLSSDMLPEEFAQAVSTLKGRLDVFTGGEPYEIHEGEDSVELYLPRSAFAGIDVEKVLKCYITRAMQLYIFDRASPDTSRELLRRDDLASVTLSQGAIPGVDAVEYGIYSPTYRYLTIQLTDQCAEWFAEDIGAWGDGLAFAQDMEFTGDYGYYYTFPAGDGKTFYVLNNDRNGQFLETLVYNLTNSPLPDSFSFTIDLNSLADWQTAESGSRMGESQCDPAALEGAAATFTMTGYQMETEEDRLDAEKALKARLDMLGQPYAVGRVEGAEEDTAVFAVRTGLEHMGMPVIPLIGGSSVQLQADYWDMDIRNGTFVWETAPDGTCTLVLEIDTTVPNNAAEFAEEMAERAGELYLSVNGMPVLRTSAEHPVSDGRIRFDRLCFGREAGITEEYRWLITLIERVINESWSTPHLQWTTQFQMDLEDGIAGYDRDRLGISYAAAEQAFADAVKAVVPDAALADERDLSCVYVNLGLEPGEDLPERAAALAQEIYEASGFEESPFQSLVVYLIDEDDSAGERARIFFRKKYAHASTVLDNTLPENGCICVSGIFRGGRLGQYRDAFLRIVETDPFYLRLTVEGQTSWK